MSPRTMSPRTMSPRTMSPRTMSPRTMSPRPAVVVAVAVTDCFVYLDFLYSILLHHLCSIAGLQIGFVVVDVMQILTCMPLHLCCYSYCYIRYLVVFYVDTMFYIRQCTQIAFSLTDSTVYTVSQTPPPPPCTYCIPTHLPSSSTVCCVLTLLHHP